MTKKITLKKHKFRRVLRPFNCSILIKKGIPNGFGTPHFCVAENNEKMPFLHHVYALFGAKTDILSCFWGILMALFLFFFCHFIKGITVAAAVFEALAYAADSGGADADLL